MARGTVDVVDDEKVLEHAVLTRVMRLSAIIYGIVAGVVAGLSLFIVTNVLVLKGGRVVGPHLSLLGQFFPGYTVTFWGSVLGLVYAFITGFLVTFLIATLYNFLVNLRDSGGQVRA